MKHFDYEISLFIDGELPDEEQNKLFEHLAECTECRSTLVEFQSTKTKFKSYYGSQLPEANGTIIPVTSEVKKIKTNLYKTAFYVAAAACLLIGILFLLNRANEKELQNKFQKLESNYLSLQQNYNIAVEQKDGQSLNTKNSSVVINNHTEPAQLKKRNINQPQREFAGTKTTKSGESKNNVVSINLPEQNNNYIQTIFTNDQAIVESGKDYRDHPNDNKNGTRDLLQLLTPHLYGGKIVIDTAKIRDLFFRHGKDNIIISSVEKNNLGYIKFPKEKSSSLYAQYINSLRSEKVTKNDFLIPQLIGN